MSPSRLLAAAVLLGLGLAVPAPAAAQPTPASDAPIQAPDPKYMYMYTDDQGILHAVDNLEAVPYRYRPTATKMVQDEAPAPGEARDDDMERRRRESDRLIEEARRKDQEKQVDEVRKKWADQEEEAGPEKKDGADKDQRIRALKEELGKLEAQVGALEEGYSPGDEFEAMGGDELDARLVNIEVRMKTIEKELKKLEGR